MTDRPYTDPVIYPGAPIEPVAGAWVRHYDGPRVCALGGEDIEPGVQAQWTGDVWRCREHAEIQAACAYEAARSRRDARARRPRLMRWAR